MRVRRKAFFVATTLFLSIGIAEVGFRLLLAVTGIDVITVLRAKDVLEEAWFLPHPYLVYVFKPNHSFVMDAFGGHQFTTNQYGFRSTLDYDPQALSKPPNALRIATLGGSTTMGVNDDDEIWPYLIGKYLSERVPDRRIEVLNEGIMGYTSLGNLLDLALRVIDFDCDVYIIYLGVNDLFAKAPLDVYRTDYSHFRVTLYERLLSSPAQSVPSLFLQLKTVRAALELGGARDSRDLISNTCTSQFRRRFWMEEGENERIERTMRETVVRNVTSMVGVIRGHRRDAMIILSSFYDLEGRRLLKDLNEDFREIAAELRIVFADVGRDVPRDQSMAYDYGHFTPEGDRRMATLFTDLVVENLASWGRRAP